MIDPINPRDKVVVVVVMTEKEDMLVDIAQVMYPLLFQIIFKI